VILDADPTRVDADKIAGVGMAATYLGGHPSFVLDTS
jgi:hypothetical protein